MSDLTPALNGILKKKHGILLARPRAYPTGIADEFLKEAYRINTHLRSLHKYLQSIRVGYLSTTLPSYRTRSAAQNRQYFTDAQRDQIDYESKSTLRDLNAGIAQLEQVEQIRKDTEAQIAAKKRPRQAFQALGRWAAGGVSPQNALTPEERLEEARQKTITAHRENVIWYLRRKLEEAAEVQIEMMQTRVEREVEKSKSALYKTKGAASAGGRMGNADMGGQGHGTASQAAMDEKNAADIEQTLSPEQLQLFAQENNEMMKHYEDTLDQVRAAEQSVIEISELQTTLAQNLEIQASRIDTLVEDSMNTERDVIGGNKQLKRAAERWRPAKYMFYVSCGLSAFLIAWDLVI